MSLPRSAPFLSRHIGPSEPEQAMMLATLGMESLEQLVEQTIPPDLRLGRRLALDEGVDETRALAELRERSDANEVWRSYLGMGYYACITPPVIRRNIFEDPGWYTAYTPYQAEISQGRLEALLLYQTMVQELTGLDIANASLLDEATAAAEAMTMAHRIAKGKRRVFRVAPDLHPQTLAVVETRAKRLDLDVVVGDVQPEAIGPETFGVLLSSPGTEGVIRDLKPVIDAAHAQGAVVTVVTDLLACTWMRAPGHLGADICVGSAQRFGVPMGYGGPHAGFMSARAIYQRHLPGRIIGISKDSRGKPALRMALQTREQHIRRHKATSNICTAQVLLAVMAGMYGVWHGPEGLTSIARRVHGLAKALAKGVRQAGHTVSSDAFFDTVRIDVGAMAASVQLRAEKRQINLRRVSETAWCVALDETVTEEDLADLLEVFGSTADVDALLDGEQGEAPQSLAREGQFMAQAAFHTCRTETEMLRYLHRLKARDLSLTTSMIPLGSCTMKLNATAEMEPVSWPGFSAVHPFAPVNQVTGYRRLFDELEAWLAEITGYAAVSLQPNAGSQGEYAGLLSILRYHESRGDHQRTVCLIPSSAHGTNPASAILAGMQVVVVACDDRGNIDVEDLRTKAEQQGDRLGALMVTYPSTHGVFEVSIREVCDLIHAGGGQVYLDGANMNAMVGLCRPGDLGADVCHLNLHKTFCIPHGGGGPGMGPIGVAAHLIPHLPGHVVVSPSEGSTEGAVSAAPWGSASILPITWAYIRMLGAHGLKRASEVAILNANYIAKRLEGHFDVLYRGAQGRVAHECILDLRGFKECGVQVDDVAKRLMDFGFHAPTMSWPVAGTLMVEPTESESKGEIDRFCDAMIAIRREIEAVERGEVDVEASALRHAPHTLDQVTATEWGRGYSREMAAFPAQWTRVHKYWPSSGRIDNAYGDRNLVCSCDAWPAPSETDQAQ